MFFSTATRPTLMNIGFVSLSIFSAFFAGLNSSRSTPRGQITGLPMRLDSRSFKTAFVGAITTSLGLWNQRRNAYVQLSGIRMRERTYSGKRV